MLSPDKTINPQPPLAENKPPRPKIALIRTYQTDIAETVQKKNLSLASIAVAEQRKRELETGGTIGAQQKSLRSLLFVGILLIVLSLGGWLVFTAYRNKTSYEPPKIGAVRVLPLIFTEKQTEVYIEKLGRSPVSEKLQNSVETTDALLGSMVNLYLTEGTLETKRLLTTERLFNALQTHAPQTLIRALKPEFMFGAHVFNGNRSFFIFKISSFDVAFSEMLRWERDLPYDLALVFNLVGSKTSVGVNPTLIQNAPSSTSPEVLQNPAATGVSLYSKPFIDAVLFNKDVRALKNESGKIVLMYAFPDRDTLVITGNEETFREIIYRLTALQSVN